MALGFPRASFRVGLCVLRDQAQVPVSDWMGALRRLHAEFRPDLRRSSFGVVLADALARQEDVLAATLDAAIPGLPVIGASTARGIRFEQSDQMVDGQECPGAAVFLLIETDFAVAEVAFTHFSPTDRRAVVTAADLHNRVILELNAEPAAQEYARLAGIPESALTATEFARHPLLLRAGRRDHVRAIRAVTPGGGLQLLSGIEAGNILTVGRAMDMTRGFADALAVSEEMCEIYLDHNQALQIPTWDFQGAPVGLDIRRVVETGITPLINTGIAHKDPGIGQVGAGTVRAPLGCFEQALEALASELGIKAE